MNEIKKLRQERNITQKELAEHLGVNRNAISRYETGKRNPDNETMISLAKYFNVSVDYLMGNTTYKFPIDTIYSNISSTFVPYKKKLPIISSISFQDKKLVYGEPCGFELADIPNPADYFFYEIKDDSMEPEIAKGALALIKKQSEIENGDILLILIDNSQLMIRKAVIANEAFAFKPFNSKYDPIITSKLHAPEIVAIGKIIQTTSTKRW